jgi:hypothetical protein
MLFSVLPRKYTLMGKVDQTWKSIIFNPKYVHRYGVLHAFVASHFGGIYLELIWNSSAFIPDFSMMAAKCIQPSWSNVDGEFDVNS